MCVGVLGLVAWLLARDVDLRDVTRQGLDFVRRAGPGVYFLCMSLLPAIGVPLSLFTLSAGPLYARELGMPLVTTLAFAAIATNMALTYFLANRALRPLLESVTRRMDYQLPKAADADATDLILLLRVTPGVPFPVQNYLLGLADVPFVPYLAISCATTLPICAAFLFLGDALLQGRGRIALLAVMLVLAALVAVHFLRRRLRAAARPAP